MGMILNNAGDGVLEVFEFHVATRRSYMGWYSKFIDTYIVL
ncbi:hypothetical protein [Caldivirga sp.]